MATPKIEIKNLKRSEFASQETHCFDATLYVDGERLCHVRNEGHGGPDQYYPTVGSNLSPRELHDRIDKINEELGKEKFVAYGIEMSKNLETVVGELIDEKLKQKEIQKILKRISYTDGKDVFQLKASVKPTEENINKVKQMSWWKPHFKLLNEMDVDEIAKMPFFSGEAEAPEDEQDCGPRP